jgi:hypothetical protein
MGVGGQRHAPAALPPGKIGAENLTFTGIRSPDRPARSGSLCELSDPGPPQITAEFYLILSVPSLRHYSGQQILSFTLQWTRLIIYCTLMNEPVESNPVTLYFLKNKFKIFLPPKVRSSNSLLSSLSKLNFCTYLWPTDRPTDHSRPDQTRPDQTNQPKM